MADRNKVLRTEFTDSELESINKVLRNGDIGFGSNVQLFESEFQNFSNKKYNVALNSASAAAFIVFSYLKEIYGACDVYTPSLAFTSPIWAAKHFGHNVIFVDVNDNLLFDCLDYKNKREAYGVSNKTILMPILYGGVGDINDWNILGDEIVVVDSAHGITPKIKCDYVFFSFHPTKPVCTSDGGMLSTDYLDAYTYFRDYRNFGRQATLNGEYDIIQEGFKFYMNNLNATIGLVSLKKYTESTLLRKSIFEEIKTLFDGRFVEHDLNSSYYFATLLSPNSNQINSKYNLAKHYPLLHKTKFYKTEYPLTNTENLYDSIVNLPLYENLYNS